MKEIKILIVIIIILSIALGIKMASSTPQYSKYSREDIVEIVNKTTGYNNYSCEYILDGSTATYKFKNNVLISNYIFTTMYIDYNSGERIMINEETKRAIVNNSTSSVTPLVYASTIYELLNDQNCTYKYLDEETYNGHNCIVIQLNGSTAKYKVWIDSESGFVLKTVDDKGIFSETTEYNIKFNSITDEEMKKPNLGGYTLRESN